VLVVLFMVIMGGMFIGKWGLPRHKSNTTIDKSDENYEKRKTATS